MALFGLNMYKFIDYMYAYALKIYQKNLLKNFLFSQSKSALARSLMQNLHKLAGKKIYFTDIMIDITIAVYHRIHMGTIHVG